MRRDSYCKDGKWSVSPIRIIAGAIFLSLRELFFFCHCKDADWPVAISGPWGTMVPCIVIARTRSVRSNLCGSNSSDVCHCEGTKCPWQSFPHRHCEGHDSAPKQSLVVGLQLVGNSRSTEKERLLRKDFRPSSQ